MHRWTGSALVQLMACRLFGAKPLSEQILTYSQLENENELKWNETGINYFINCLNYRIPRNYINDNRYSRHLIICTCGINDGNSLHWRHNGHDSVSNDQPHDCLLNRLFRRRSKKYESSVSLAFVRGIHRRAVNSPHKWPVTRKMFSFDDIIMGKELRVNQPSVISLRQW